MWPYHISAGYKGQSQPVCAVMSFLIKNENPLEGGEKSCDRVISSRATMCLPAYTENIKLLL